MATRVDLKAVEEFLRNKTYPKSILKDKGKKSNFRKACKIGDNSKAKPLVVHRGRECTYQKISERFFWHGMIEDIKEYIKICKSCQQQGKIFKKVSLELKSISVLNEVMKRIDIDLCTLPEVDGFKHLIVCIDYFSKWSEPKAVKDKSAPKVFVRNYLSTWLNENTDQ